MSDETKETGLPESLTFHYIKSPQCREIFVEGAYGGITPRGYISFSVYKERLAIPSKVVNKINPDGTLGIETERETKDGVIRTVEANLYMDKITAQSLIDWLQQKVRDLTIMEEEAQTKSSNKETN